MKTQKSTKNEKNKVSNDEKSDSNDKSPRITRDKGKFKKGSKSDEKGIFPPYEKKMTELNIESKASRISIDSSNFLISNFLESSNSQLIDRTSFIKYVSVCLMIEKLLANYEENDYKFLILVPKTKITEWFDHLTLWTLHKHVLCSSDVSEKRELRQNDMIYDQRSTPPFSVLVMSYEQFEVNNQLLPKFKWASVILDSIETKIDLLDLAFYNRVFIFKDGIDSKTVRKILDNKSVPIFTITYKDAADNNLYVEKIFFTPLTPVQRVLYMQYLSEIVADLKECNEYSALNELIEPLRNIIAHPRLYTEMKPDEAAHSSAKSKVLLKLLAKLKEQNKSAIIICSNPMVDILHNEITETKINSVKLPFDDSKDHGAGKVVKSLKSDEFVVIVTSNRFMSVILKNFSGDIIISYDNGWVSSESADLIVEWYSRFPNAEVYRLLSPSTYEYLTFQYFWKHREMLPSAIENNSKNFSLLKDIVFQCYKYAYINLTSIQNFYRASIKDTKSILFSDIEAFPEIDFTWDDKYFDLTMVKQGGTIEKVVPYFEFWTAQRLERFYLIFQNFGWNRWDKCAEFSRAYIEYQRLAVIIVKSLFSKYEGLEGKYQYLWNIVNGPSGKFDQEKFSSRIAAFAEVSTKYDETFLSDVDSLLYFDSFLNGVKRNSEDPSTYITKDMLNEDWTAETIMPVINNIYNNGVMMEPRDRAEFAKSVVRNADREFTVRSKRLKVNTLEKNIKKSKIDLSAHNKVTSGLLKHGYSDIESFMKVCELEGYAQDAIKSYTEGIVYFCTNLGIKKKDLTQNIQKRAKLTKLQRTRIAQSVELFRMARNALTDIESISAEDFEALYSITEHGFSYPYSSPILQCLMKGDFTDTKLISKLKSILDDRKNRKHVEQNVAEEILDNLPIRINDRMMLLTLGEIDPQFHDELFIYPIGYSIAVLLPSLVNTEVFEWYEVSIKKKSDNLSFRIKPHKADKPVFVSSCIDTVVNLFRTSISKKSQTPVGFYKGAEIFGLTTAFVNKIFTYLPRFEECSKYKKRFFSTSFFFTQKWPIIGTFERIPDPVVLEGLKHNKFQYKKQQEPVCQLTVNLKPLFNDTSLGYTFCQFVDEDTRDFISSVMNCRDFSDLLMSEKPNIK